MEVHGVWGAPDDAGLLRGAVLVGNTVTAVLPPGDLGLTLRAKRIADGRDVIVKVYEVPSRGRNVAQMRES